MDPVKEESTDAATKRSKLSTAGLMLITSRFRHLKKQDGNAYWKSDIQFEFLTGLMFNGVRAFRLPFTVTRDDVPLFSLRTREGEGQTIDEILAAGSRWTFFELYVMTLIQSDRISKILKDRLILDINYAFNFAVLAFLVNIGRLNTTVNFDYEMRSQLRTFHSIPSLQVKNNLPQLAKVYTVDVDQVQDAHDPPQEEPLDTLIDSFRTSSGYTMATVKQLQDTPRLKSILKSVSNLTKGVSKYFDEFVAQIRGSDRSTPDQSSQGLNAVSLIFLLCSFEAYTLTTFLGFSDICREEEIEAEQKKRQEEGGSPFSTGILFHDIWFHDEIHPAGKSQRFLWLMYAFLETNLSPKDLAANPFNEPGFEPYEEGTQIKDWYATIIPKYHFVGLGEEFDVDTEEERKFGERMKEKRLNYIRNGAKDEKALFKKPNVRSSQEHHELPDSDTAETIADTSDAEMPDAEAGQDGEADEDEDEDDTIVHPAVIRIRGLTRASGASPTIESSFQPMRGNLGKFRTLVRRPNETYNRQLHDFVKEYFSVQDRRMKTRRAARGNIRYFWNTPTAADSNLKIAEYLLLLGDSERADYRDFYSKLPFEEEAERQRSALSPTATYLDYGEFKRAYHRSLVTANRRLSEKVHAFGKPSRVVDSLFEKL
ncbi:unnamed protein product [Kuraishia capsulata CBS 1993]|uniref:Ino eighty subunit 1 n=1 Tax=Kuraishia capsulata CBS 1993 TaxID=1382522 RepID=W6MX45_9ASCO|nr:uncharacterized protein KUCA_T00004232001 [Kuraishia capsulata CBS 1993]CDK28250.1 unnamed protein product [Kuraishia capsulata CBS 1993]